MKPFLLLPILTVGALAAGCGAQDSATTTTQTETTAQNAPSETPVTQPVAATTPAAPKKTTASSITKTTTTTVAKTSTKPGPVDTRYRAAAKDLGPGAPAALLEALKKTGVPLPPKNFVVPAKARVQMQTSRGPITIELNGKEAPLHVKSFLYLAGRGFFDGTKFHRHADLLGDGNGFIIQGGDPLSKSTTTAEFAGVGGPGYEIPRERNKLTHKKLVIAAARSQDPNSAGSQFYITQGDVPFLDQGDGYTVFGKVVAGGDAALKLAQDDTLQRVTVLTR